CIENGADVFLFARDLESDFNLMLQGLEKGILSKKRLDEAVIRILGLKASLGLHLDGKALQSQSSLSILGCPDHKRLAAQCADKAIILVKDTQRLLPVSPKKYPRIYLNVLEPNDSPNTWLKKKLLAKLRNMGFEPTLRDRRALAGLSVLADEGASIFAKAASIFRARNSLKELTGKPSDFTGNYDLALYVANFQPESENTVIRIDWKGFKGMGNDVPWFISEIPTLFVSLGSPYHLQDVPMIKTFINAYGANDETIDLVFEKLAGLSKFSGTSPVDPSCGREDALF
ncbi:MAG: glycoside hydrolase family 3 protein, partial [Clostridiales bacterium]|nr:glycoside hydrolase family 3 protein [Clostridiales bacterium]